MWACVGFTLHTLLINGLNGIRPTIGVYLLHVGLKLGTVKPWVGLLEKTRIVGSEFLTIVLVVDLTDNLGDKGEMFAGEV